MPFVPDEDARGAPPTKRRKLTQSSTMARSQKDYLPENRWEFDHDMLPTTEKHIEGGTPGAAEPCIRTSSREELIECIKRGQKPTWVPTPSFQALCDEEEALNAQRKLKSSHAAQNLGVEQTHNNSPPPKHDYQPALSLDSGPQTEPRERPRSALHRGDFSESDSPSPTDFWTNPDYQPGLAISTLDHVGHSPSRWYGESPHPTSFVTMSYSKALSSLTAPFVNRRRAPSLGSSLSSSFIMRAPTSPLVNATVNPYLDSPTEDTEPEPHMLRRDSTRRRTMPPNSFQSFNMSPVDATPPNFSRPLAPALRREVSMPTHTHRAQRSLSSFTYHPRSNPQTPLMRSRRPSMSSDAGSRRRTSMVGSFEESILRGRMSTPPSKPFDFVAQIGVMGKGECQPSLKCPAHVTVPFPAVFYSYPASTVTRSVADDTPSPYVGTINLDHHLKAVTLAVKKNKKDAFTRKDRSKQPESLEDTGRLEDALDSKLHIGGAYRIPQQGQLQIVIKNPNKTAVKLFLVPYDLSGMEAGTKTFVRQRCYSTGSIIENALGGDKSITQFIDPLGNKHILRYLVHLKFCCPAKNRFYLYDDIRVVFANRVPDGKEKLRNELQVPEPKFSTWKPSKPERLTKASKSAPSTPIVAAFEFESPQFFGDMDGFPPVESPASPTPSARRVFHSSPLEFPKIRSKPSQDLANTPFEFADIKSTSGMTHRPEQTLSPVTGFAPSTPLQGSPVPWRTPSSGNHSTRSFSPAPESRDSLLSKQLRELNGQSTLVKEKTPEKAGIGHGTMDGGN